MTKCLALALSLCLSPALPAQGLSDTSSEIRRLNESFIALAEKLAPAVVLVTSNAYQPASRDSGGPAAYALREATGSGVILSGDGFIVSNAHVVAGATRIQVQLSAPHPVPGKSILRPPGRLFPARLVGLDAETDLALLKVDAAGLPHLALADSDFVRQGQLVLALGSPLGLNSSLSMGVISAVARQLRPDDRMIFLQTDAPINPGNSGGPLVNIDGEVIGINTLILSQSGGSEGLGFAVPANIVRSVTDQLRMNGYVRRGDIGVEAQTVTPALATGLGLPRQGSVVLADVLPRGPADNAGLRIGDVVLALNGKPMENARQFHVNLYQQPVASTVTLEIFRGGEKLAKTVVVLDRRDGPDRFAFFVDERQNLVTRLAILALAIDRSLIEQLPVTPRRSYGILVARLVVTPSGPTGVFLPGDIIYTLDNQPVSTLKELRDLLEKRPAGDVVILQVERAGRIRYLEVPLD